MKFNNHTISDTKLAYELPKTFLLVSRKAIVFYWVGFIGYCTTLKMEIIKYLIFQYLIFQHSQQTFQRRFNVVFWLI